jgi:outer membrane protein assembly factor BamE (lipoprotein component of BamABCDE complex)
MRYLLLVVMIVSIGCSDSKPARTRVAQNLPTRMGYASVSIPHASQPSSENKKTYTRDELTKLLVGKTIDEVKELLGKPYGSSATNVKVTWYYSEIAYDPDTGEVDILTYIHFVNGKVERVGD